MARRMISALRSRCCMQLAGLLVFALWGNAQADTLLLLLMNGVLGVARELVDLIEIISDISKFQFTDTVHLLKQIIIWIMERPYLQK